MADLVSHPDEVKVVSKRFGLGATNIDRYLELDGYKAVQKALSMEPDAIINEVKNSGLRGRGGAGFSTGHEVVVRAQAVGQAEIRSVQRRRERAWHLQRPADFRARSAFGDRRRDDRRRWRSARRPDTSTFAASIAICWRSCRRRLRDAYARDFSARTFSAAGSDFDIYWHGGAGAYEVGEESALMESLEGKRGIPRIRPPFPAVVGLWGGPTVINNAETLASVPHIILGGAEWYANLGTPKNGGTRLFCLSGQRRRSRAFTNCRWATTSRR